MQLDQRIKAFVKLGLFFKKISSVKNEDAVFNQAFLKNNFFTKENICYSLLNFSKLLKKKNLEKWLSSYDLSKKRTYSILVICAGNIPLVSFHDILCVLVTGNKLILKLSNKDNVLPFLVLNKLIEIQPKFSKKIIFSNFSKTLKFDKVISTGSNSSIKYFNYYFKKKPSIIRSNRSSVAVLSGKETSKELKALSSDIFRYFGLGCRNITKLFIPKGYDIKLLQPYFNEYISNISNNYYYDNYVYNKAILKLNKFKFHDFKNILVLESNKLHPPISVLYFEYYNEISDINLDFDKVQCIVSNNYNQHPTILFGQAQCPKLDDYADKIDTISFLLS